MSDLARMLAYAQAFELAHVSDDWSIIEPCFAPEVVHHVEADFPMGAHNERRDAVVAGLATGVRDLDRRFDARIAEIIEGPTPRADGVFMRFRLTFCRAGLPDLTFEGDHLAVYDGHDAIIRLDEAVAPEACASIVAYFTKHDAALRPAGSGPVLTNDPALLTRIEDATNRSLVRIYGSAKSHQDIEAALTACSGDFTIDSVSFGLESRDRADTVGQLELFFHAFPDYGVTVDGLTSGPATASCWGTATMTFSGEFLGYPPTGKTATYPFFSAFEFKDGLLSRERFFFDLATLCDGIGLPMDAVAELLKQLREAA